MSWESSLEYYRIINATTQARLGPLQSAKIVMYSVNFADVETLQHEERWDEAADLMVDAAQRVERAGADFLVLCTNTMHKLADAIAANTQIPFLHIADATAQRILVQDVRRVALLGTRFTMEQAFYRERLQQHGLAVLIPTEADRAIAHRIIYEELCRGMILPESKAEYIRIMEQLIATGAEGIILGCTEIELLVGDGDAAVPVFPTARLHAEAAVDWAIA
jgi:aspartate racemase